MFLLSTILHPNTSRQPTALGNKFPLWAWTTEIQAIRTPPVLWAYCSVNTYSVLVINIQTYVSIAGLGRY